MRRGRTRRWDHPVLNTYFLAGLTKLTFQSPAFAAGFKLQGKGGNDNRVASELLGSRSTERYRTDVARLKSTRNLFPATELTGGAFSAASLGLPSGTNLCGQGLGGGPPYSLPLSAAPDICGLGHSLPQGDGRGGLLKPQSRIGFPRPDSPWQMDFDPCKFPFLLILFLPGCGGCS